MPRGVAKAKDGVEKKVVVKRDVVKKDVVKKDVVKKDVVKKDVVKKDVVRRSRKMRGGGKLLQHIISALENNNLVYDDIFDKIIGQFDKIEDDLKKKKDSIPSKAITNTAKNTHMEHIRQIDKFKSKNIEDIPSLLDLKKLLFYINKIEGYDKIDINILYSNIIILYIYNFFEIIKSIIETNDVDIDIVDNVAVSPAAASAAAPAVSPGIETDTAILARMKQQYDIHKLQFEEIRADKKLIYARVISVIQTMTGINSVDYTKYDLKTYFISKNNYIKEILTKYIQNINKKIQYIKTSTKSDLFNALYINDLENEISEIDNIIRKWLSSILIIIV